MRVPDSCGFVDPLVVPHGELLSIFREGGGPAETEPGYAGGSWPNQRVIKRISRISKLQKHCHLLPGLLQHLMPNEARNR